MSANIPETTRTASVARPHSRGLRRLSALHALALILTQPHKADTETGHEGHEGIQTQGMSESPHTTWQGQSEPRSLAPCPDALLLSPPRPRPPRSPPPCTVPLAVWATRQREQWLLRAQRPAPRRLKSYPSAPGSAAVSPPVPPTSGRPRAPSCTAGPRPSRPGRGAEDHRAVDPPRLKQRPLELYFCLGLFFSFLRDN